MASIAFDIQNLAKKLDRLDAKGPTSRNLQSAWAMAQTINSLLQATKADGAGHYTLSEDWTEATRTPYEAAVDAAQVALTAALAQLKVLVKA